MEYSIEKDALFCLRCHLFRPNWREQLGDDCFVGNDYSNSKKKENIQKHVEALIVPTTKLGTILKR